MVLLERRLSRVVAWLVVSTLVVSIAAAVDARHGGRLHDLLALVPAEVWRGQLWRLVTWVFVEESPLALIFTCLVLYQFGIDLERTWGERRFLGYVGAIVGVAAVGTSLVGLVHPLAREAAYPSGWALGDALVIAWALRFPEARVRVWYLVVVGGKPLAYGTFAVTVLFAAFYGAWWFLPELIAGASALLYMTGAARRLAGRLGRLRRRRRGLRVVRGGRGDGPYSTN